MTVTNIVTLLGGIALFLFGMTVMGDALKKVAGSKLEVILYKLAGNTFKGILLGTGVTAVIQSSSATSVMVVGFVNSGMMKTKQAISVILGAILGTSITGWVLCLNSVGGSGASIASLLNTAMITGVVSVVGIVLRMFCKQTITKNIGEILLGFGVLMFGMSAMSDAVAPLKESSEFISVLTKFSNPILGILAGLIITSIIQSASAAVGILQALAVTGAITFQVALPVIMGIGIGASVPVLLTALGASPAGKRTAFSYLFIDVSGAIICGVIFYALNAIIHFDFMGTTLTMVSIALVNTLFRLATLIFLAPATGLLDKITTKLFPDNEETLAEKMDMERLETRFLEHTALAIEQSRLVINSMAQKAQESVLDAIELRGGEYSEKGFNRVCEMETVLDRYEDKLGNYLNTISRNGMPHQQRASVGKFMHSLSDYERISDHALNIAESAKELSQKKIVFTDEAKDDLRVLEEAIHEIIENTVKAFTEDDAELAKTIEPLESVVDELCDEMKFRHINRVNDQQCTLQHGFIFNDLLTDYERISDHCSNIALVVIEGADTNFDAHEYAENIVTDENFDNMYRDYMEKYKLK